MRETEVADDDTALYRCAQGGGTWVSQVGIRASSLEETVVRELGAER